MMKFFTDFPSYEILEKLVKTSYMEGLTNSLEDEAIAKLKDIKILKNIQLHRKNSTKALPCQSVLFKF